VRKKPAKVCVGGVGAAVSNGGGYPILQLLLRAMAGDVVLPEIFGKDETMLGFNASAAGSAASAPSCGVEKMMLVLLMMFGFLSHTFGGKHIT
jgi:hypothetical protein